jgi:hypothetical protein
MSLRTWISNLAHRLVGMEADSVNPHVLAAITDIQWALRELANREEGAQDSDAVHPCKINKFSSRTCEFGTNSCVVMHRALTHSEGRVLLLPDRCGYQTRYADRVHGCQKPKGHDGEHETAYPQPASAEKPQPVADKEWAIGHGKTADEARANLAEHRVLILRKDLERRIAEARTAAREEALREVRSWAERRSGVGFTAEYRQCADHLCTMLDGLLARPSGEVKS